MRVTNRLAVLMLGGLLGLASCDRANCVPWSYSGGFGTCPASGWDLTLQLQELQVPVGRQEPVAIVDVMRLDVRAVNKDVRLKVTATRKSGGEPTPLIKVPTVQMSQDGGNPRLLSAELDATEKPQESRTLILSVDEVRKSEVRKLGPFEFQVTLDVPSEQEGTLSARTGGRVFRSPIFWDPPQEVAYPSNPFGPTPVTGRTGVQVGSPIGVGQQLLVSEQYKFGLDDRRWLDLYAANAQGKVDYYTSASWDLVQQQLTEKTDAQLVLVKGAVMIYQTDSVTSRPDLTLLPLSGARQSGLSRVDVKIPSDAKRLAGCAEDSVIVLGRPSAVLFFQTNPSPLMRPIQYLGELSFPGTPEPVIATRDLSAGSGVKASEQYYSVIADAMGNLTLVELIRSGQVPSAVTSKPIGNAVTGGSAVTALALADLDSDGLQDIILATKDGALSWSPQQPDGSFKLAEPLSVRVPLTMGSGAFPIGLSVGDVTGDGIPDIAVATSEQRVFVYKNQ